MRMPSAVLCCLFLIGCGDEPEEVTIKVEGMPGFGTPEQQAQWQADNDAEEAEETARRSDEAAATAELGEWIEKWYFDGKYTSDNAGDVAFTRDAIDSIATDRDLTEAGKRAARIRDRIDVAMDAARETARAREVEAGERPTGRRLNETETAKLLADMDAALVD